VVCELVEHYHRRLHLPAHHIGVITPYWAQAGLIRQQITFILLPQIQKSQNICFPDPDSIRLVDSYPDPGGQK
jgi:hypothetical protein